MTKRDCNWTTVHAGHYKCTVCGYNEWDETIPTQCFDELKEQRWYDFMKSLDFNKKKEDNV